MRSPFSKIAPRFRIVSDIKYQNRARVYMDGQELHGVTGIDVKLSYNKSAQISITFLTDGLEIIREDTLESNGGA